MDLDLDGRVYLVTGGSAGLGRATASVLVAEGARVVLGGRHKSTLDAAAEKLGPANATSVCRDNADPAASRKLVEAAWDMFGRLDGLLISVGGPPAGRVGEVSDDQWRSSFESVFLGAVRLARDVAASLTKGGSIVFVLSTSVRTPIAELAISNGLRPGLAMVAKSLATEYGPAGVRVNGLLPGRVATDRLNHLESRMTREDRRATYAAIPLRRPGQPAEFGRMAAFLLSPAASYITGTMIAVDGGASPGI